MLKVGDLRRFNHKSPLSLWSNSCPSEHSKINGFIKLNDVFAVLDIIYKIGPFIEYKVCIAQTGETGWLSVGINWSDDVWVKELDNA